jgi:hypothetical protein
MEQKWLDASGYEAREHNAALAIFFNRFWEE